MSGPESLISHLKDYKVSSVLNNDRKVYGKKFLFDGKDENCWNSDQGTPQWIQLSFRKPVTISQLNIQFQGGFAGKDCCIEAWRNNDAGSEEKDKGPENSYRFTPNDSNSVQEIPLPASTSLPSSQFRLWFNSSTDFYGRIIIYYFDIIGYHNVD